MSLAYAKVGSGWLNPTEGEVWPLAETLAVASLAFQGLDANVGEAADGDGDDDNDNDGESISGRLTLSSNQAGDTNPIPGISHSVPFVTCMHLHARAYVCDTPLKEEDTCEK